MTTVYFLCGLVTVVTLFYVFGGPASVFSSPEKTRLNYLQERKDVVYENLRDLNFEYRAGKLSTEDYNSLKASLEEEAAAILAESARLQGLSGIGSQGISASTSETKGGRA
jgi:hypothetical protein